MSHIGAKQQFQGQPKRRCQELPQHSLEESDKINPTPSFLVVGYYKVGRMVVDVSAQKVAMILETAFKSVALEVCLIRT